MEQPTHQRSVQGVSHTPPSGGLIPPNFRTTPPPGFRGKWGREGKGRKGEREKEKRREGKGPPRVG